MLFQVETLLVLNVTSVGVRYYMAHKDNSLFVSLPNEKKVLEIELDADGTVKQTSTLIGSGKPCLGNGVCGDGGDASKARLTYPKVTSKLKGFFSHSNCIFDRV